MKTLKLVRNSLGKLDIVNNNGRATTLDSDTQQKEFGEQRIEKAFRSRINMFDPRYGVAADRYIGSKAMFLLLVKDVERQERFFRDTVQRSGTAAITSLTIEEIEEENTSVSILATATMPKLTITVGI